MFKISKSYFWYFLLLIKLAKPKILSKNPLKKILEPQNSSKKGLWAENSHKKIFGAKNSYKKLSENQKS